MSVGYVVRTVNPTTGDQFWLRRTTYAFQLDRAERFGSEDQARAALERSRKFNAGWAYRNARVEPEDASPPPGSPEAIRYEAELRRLQHTDRRQWRDGQW